MAEIPKKTFNRVIPWFYTQFITNAALPLVALFFAMLLSSLVIIVLGKDPLIAFGVISSGAFGNRNAIAEVLVKTTPLLLVGLGTAFAFRCQMWNIGAEGQLLIGALASSWFCLLFPNIPPVISIILALTVAFIAGGIWAGIAGYLKVKLGASEIINTIMMNYIAIFLVNYLVRNPLKDKEMYVPQSALFAPQYWLPKVIPTTRLHLGIIVAALAVIAIYIVLRFTTLGFEVIAVGSNPKAAQLGGILPAKSMVIAMFISGGLAGLAGAGEVLGLYHRILDGVSAGYGFSAMAVAILGNLQPFNISIFAFLLAALRVGADQMQRQMGVPAALIYLIEGLVIIFIQGKLIFSIIIYKLRMIKPIFVNQSRKDP